MVESQIKVEGEQEIQDSVREVVEHGYGEVKIIVQDHRVTLVKCSKSSLIPHQ